MNSLELFTGVLFGAIGIGYVLYGRRQRVLTPFVAGIGLIGFPYFVSGTFATIAVGTVLILLPFIVSRLERG